LVEKSSVINGLEDKVSGERDEIGSKLVIIIKEEVDEEVVKAEDIYGGGFILFSTQ
jgi:hypothetical protein